MRMSMLSVFDADHRSWRRVRVRDVLHPAVIVRPLRVPSFVALTVDGNISKLGCLGVPAGAQRAPDSEFGWDVDAASALK
ncbi:hypothetical protein WOLCODRAFT_153923 [Wolfiporia cocos MD-104 SS10]|uniref:Uncharacterized protein n=1 Tax=Wolfiporia cocos (strain MD-104) TaxID=742152 RepID=A0A2H3JNW0_WOLCO|nr:hypothetical protein WOLCODRAFT_153923 [Wolfiporia cocos MD-104 SS10]